MRRTFIKIRNQIGYTYLTDRSVLHFLQNTVQFFANKFENIKENDNVLRNKLPNFFQELTAYNLSLRDKMRKLLKNYPSKKAPGLVKRKTKRLKNHSRFKKTEELLQRSVMCDCALPYMYTCVCEEKTHVHTQSGGKCL